jgi:hypothetical protein
MPMTLLIFYVVLWDASCQLWLGHLGGVTPDATP